MTQTKYIKILLLMFTLLLMPTFSYAVVQDCTNLTDAIFYWDFEDGAKDTSNHKLYDGTLVNSPTLETSNCVEGSCYSFARADEERITIADSPDWDAPNGFTVSMWYYHMDITNSNFGRWFSAGDQASDASWAYGQSQNNDAFNIVMWNGGQAQDTSTNPIGTGNFRKDRWTHIMIVKSGNDHYFYFNGTLKEKLTVAKAFAPAGSGFSLNGRYNAPGWTEFFSGIVDEVAVWNRSLAANEVLQMYNEGNYCNPFVVIDNTRNMSESLPSDGYVSNVNTINFNLSLNSSTNYTCYLFINTTENLSTYGGASPYTNQNISFDQTFPDAHYKYQINCTNAAGSDITTSKSFIVDTTSPTITTIFSDYSIQYYENLTGQFNFSDNLALYSYNISVDSAQIAGNTSMDTTFFSFNLNHNITSLSIGAHTLTVRVADGHTSHLLKDKDAWDWNNGWFDDYFKVEWEYPHSEGEITIKSKGGAITDNWDGNYLSDRLTFSFEPPVLSDTYTFEVESDFPIDIITLPNSKYKQWMVINGEHWLDFYIEDQPKINVKIVNTGNPKEYEVTLTNVDPTVEILNFNSLGDLNIFTQNYTFYTTNVTTSYSAIVSELSTQNYTIIVNKTENITSTNVLFNYNNSFRTLTKTITSNYDSYFLEFYIPSIAASSSIIPIYWLINITGDVNNISTNITRSQTVYKLQIDNCSNNTYVRALNLSLVDDFTKVLKNGSTAGHFTVWVDILSNFVDFNLSWGASDRFGICIYPNTSSYKVFGELEYGAPGYSDKTYYLTNATLDNNSENLTLYLTNGSSLVTFTVSDQDDTNVPGVYINILKYDLGTNSHVISEIIKSDELGEALGSIVLNTQFYKFLLVLNSVTVLETAPIKITSTSRNFRITLLTDFFDTYDAAGNITTGLTFTNTTKNFAYTFLNPTGMPVTACLKVIERSVRRDLLINTTCLNAASGTILINVGNDTSTAGKTFIATATTAASPSFLQDSLTISFADGYKKWGREGIYATVYLRLGLAMIGIFNPMIAIILVVIVDFFMIILGLYSLSWPIIGVYLILAGLAIWRLNQK